jgi:hypothetical protein
MYKRKKKKTVAKARMSHTKRKVKRAVKRRAPMAKKKSETPTWDDEPEDDVEEATAADPKAGTHQDVAEDESEPEPELTTTEATDEGVYKLGQACVIRGQSYPEGATVALSPEELESVQAVGVKIYPAD